MQIYSGTVTYVRIRFDHTAEDRKKLTGAKRQAVSQVPVRSDFHDFDPMIPNPRGQVTTIRLSEGFGLPSAQSLPRNSLA